MDFDKDGQLVLQSTGWENLYVPPPQEAKYEISGPSSQIITFSVGVGETILSEPGSLLYMSSGMKPDASYEGCFGRTCSGEACYALKFTNEGGSENRALLALTPSFPTSKVVPVNLSDPSVGGKLIADTGAFMASYGDVTVDVSFDCNFCRACCAGTNLVRQKLSGSGTAFLSATGTIVQKVLADGEAILADGDCILAFASTVKIEVKKAGSIMGMIGGGEGIFNTSMTGPGLVMLHSMNQARFKKCLTTQKIYRR